MVAVYVKNNLDFSFVGNTHLHDCCLYANCNKKRKS